MSNEFNLEYFMDKISVPSDKVNREKLNELILGPTTSRIGVRQFVNKILQKPKNDFIVYVRNHETDKEGTWSKGQLLYCHLTSPTSDVIINDETNSETKRVKRVNDTDIQTQKTFNNNSSNEIGGRKKRTRKQKQKPSRKGKKTKKSRFSAKKSRINRKNKRKGKTNRKNN